MPEPEPPEVVDTISALRERIAQASDHRTRLVAITKGFGPAAIDAAVAAGVTDIGESYADELVSKASPLRPEVRWHFVGRLQRNKVRRIASTVDLWHSIDRDRLVDEVAGRSPGASVLVQVDTTGEPSKGGCSVAEAPSLIERGRARGLDVVGLMTIGPTSGSNHDVSVAFDRLRRLAEAEGITELSMGMSGDWELAIDHGSTMVRLGTALFGPRPPR